MNVTPSAQDASQAHQQELAALGEYLTANGFGPDRMRAVAEINGWPVLAETADAVEAAGGSQ